MFTPGISASPRAILLPRLHGGVASYMAKTLRQSESRREIPTIAMPWMIGSKGLNRIRVETFSKASLLYRPNEGRLKVLGSDAECRLARLCVDILLRQFEKQPVLGAQVRRDIDDLADLGIVCKSAAIDERAAPRKETVFDVEVKYNVIIFIDSFIDRAHKHNFGHSMNMKMPLHV